MMTRRDQKWLVSTSMGVENAGSWNCQLLQNQVEIGNAVRCARDAIKDTIDQSKVVESRGKPKETRRGPEIHG